MSFIKKMMKSFSNFTMVDAGVFELYLFFSGIVIAQLLPVVLTLNVWVYVVVVAVWLAIVLPSIFKKGKENLWIDMVMNNYRNLRVWEIVVYKILIAFVAFLVLTLFPVLMTVDVVWYVAIAFFGMGYIMAVMFRKK